MQYKVAAKKLREILNKKYFSLAEIARQMLAYLFKYLEKHRILSKK